MNYDPAYSNALLDAVRIRKIRTMKDFAESEVILPNGPMEGMRFSCVTMPWTESLFDIIDSHAYRRHFLMGPVQSGKTLLGFQIPVMYHLFEVQETVIVACPNLDMAQGIWEERILPIVEKTRYRELLPKKGKGSKGGAADSIRFGNGSILRFMGAGAGDSQRSSYTSRVVVMTEVDKMDTAKGVSREASPVHQFEARTAAYGSRACIYGECTVSTKTGLIWREVMETGTGTQIYSPCPHCGAWILPDRERLTGVATALSVVEARDNVGYVCPECGVILSETDRQTSLATPKIAHKGQTVQVNGSVTGNPPPTMTFGLRWSAWDNSFFSLSDIAEREYRALNSEDESDEKALHQFVWSVPWEPKISQDDSLKANRIVNKVNNHPRSVIPASCEKVVLSIDAGTRIGCYWMLTGFEQGMTSYIVDYGFLEVMYENRSPEAALLAVLRQFRDGVINHGWKDTNGAHRDVDLVVVDSGYLPDTMYLWCRESGPTYKPIKGVDGSRNQSMFRPSKSKSKYVGNHWVIQPVKSSIGNVPLLHIDVDHWRRSMQQRLRSPLGTAGCLSLFAPNNPKTHFSIARHLVAEIEVEKTVDGKGLMRVWEKQYSQNHWGDAATYSFAGADYVGIKLFANQHVVQRPQQKKQTGRPVESRQMQSRPMGKNSPYSRNRR